MDTNNLKDKLYQNVLAQARKLVEESGLTEPPFLPARLVRGRPINIVFSALGFVGGLLIPHKNGFTIKVNRLDPPERQNFSCAHEIVHTFFYEREAKALLEELCAAIGQQACNKFEERLCEVGAAELLMPSPIFQKFASRYDFSIEGLVPLSRDFQASIQATAIRIGEVAPQRCQVLRGKWDTTKKSLQILTLSTTTLKARIPKGEAHFVRLKGIQNENHPLLKAFWSRDAKPLYFDEKVSLGGLQQRRRIECQAFGSGDSKFVVALVFPVPL